MKVRVGSLSAGGMWGEWRHGAAAQQLVFEAMCMIRERPFVNLDRLCAAEDFHRRNPALVLMVPSCR